MDKTAAIQAVIAYQQDRINTAANMTSEIRAKLEDMLAKIVAALESKDNSWYAMHEVFASESPTRIAAAALRAISPEMKG